jgi:hypothetical protein
LPPFCANIDLDIYIQGELRPQPNQENLEPPASLKAQRSPSKKGKGHIFYLPGNGK